MLRLTSVALLALSMIAGPMALPAAAQEFTIGLSQESLDHPWLAKQRKQIEDAAEAAGVRLLATDGQGSVVKQIAGIEDMMSKGINLLMVQAGKAEGLRQQLATLKERGIPYMFVGKPIMGTDAVTMVSMDNELIGKQIGEFIVAELTKKNGSPKGNIVIIEGIPGDETSVLRIGGAMSVISQNPEIKVVAQQPAEYRRPQAVSVTQNILQANPPGTIDVIYAANGEMALGAIQAVKDAGRSGEMIVIGLDGQKEEFDAIRAGDLAATWLYAPAGDKGFEAALKILKGDDVPPQIVLESAKITSENVDQIEPAF